MKYVLMSMFVVLLSGCALTEYAKDYFSNAVDMNQYEEAKNIDSALCDPVVLARLQKTRSVKWYNETVADCTKRGEQAVPLAN